MFYAPQWCGMSNAAASSLVIWSSLPLALSPMSLMTMCSSKCSARILPLHSRSVRSRSLLGAVVVGSPPLFLSTHVLKKVASFNLVGLDALPAVTYHVIVQCRGDCGVVIDFGPIPLNSGYLSAIPCGSQRSIFKDDMLTNLQRCSIP